MFPFFLCRYNNIIKIHERHYGGLAVCIQSFVIRTYFKDMTDTGYSGSAKIGKHFGTPIAAYPFSYSTTNSCSKVIICLVSSVVPISGVSLNEPVRSWVPSGILLKCICRFIALRVRYSLPGIGRFGTEFELAGIADVL